MKLHKPLFHVSSVAVLLALTASEVRAGLYTGTLYYTNDNGGSNVNSVAFSYNDATTSLSLGAHTHVASTPGADGIIFAPNGNLLVGGQGAAVYQVDPATGSFTTANTNGEASFHLALDPSGQSVWTSSFGGAAVNVPLGSFGTGVTTHAITGSDTGITTLAFTPGGTVFYIDGQPNNFGNFGTINLNTFTTTRIFSSLNGAHGMFYDPFTGDLILAGGGRLLQIDPNHPGAILSSLTIGNNIDQISVDGQGHLFAADNGNGAVIFVDYRATGLIGTATFAKSVGGFANIDDLAPLAGLGSAVPEPSALSLTCTGIVTVVGFWWRRRRREAA